MLDNLISFFKKMGKKEDETELLPSSSDAAKERLHLVLMQDRANVSVDFMDMMKQEILDVIKKYIDIDEKEMDVRLTNQINEDGSNGAPALYANIPIVAIKNEKHREEITEQTQKKEVSETEDVEKIKETEKKKTTKSASTSSTKKVNKEESDAETKEKKVTKTKKTVEKKVKSSEE